MMTANATADKAKKKKKAASAKKRVKFQITTDEICDVYVAGTFNNWDGRAKKMKRQDDGSYSITMLLPRGRHEYKFVVNDVWCVDPECDEWTTNNMGSLNSVINV